MKHNSKCPICQQPVYYYQSENGGKVYFDDLGPPWPKHDCANNIKLNYLKEKAINSSKVELSWKLLIDFSQISKISEEGFVYKLTGTDEFNGKKEFFLKIDGEFIFDECYFVFFGEMQNDFHISILMHDKNGEFFIAEGCGVPNRYSSLIFNKIHDYINNLKLPVEGGFSSETEFGLDKNSYAEKIKSSQNLIKNQQKEKTAINVNRGNSVTLDNFDLINEIKALDEEIEELLQRLSKINQAKTQLLERILKKQ